MDTKKEVRFLKLVDEVKACTKCPRMNGSTRVLGPGCGPLDARILFIGEAPGRLGADDTELPFHGDQAGHNFESLISQVGLSRYQLFVTNAVLCNPKDSKGNNSTPNSNEIRNCTSFLERQIMLVNPKVVVTLGSTALKACDNIEHHGLLLKKAVRTENQWRNRLLVPMYHPGQRAMLHRSFANQLADYQFLAELIAKLDRKGRRSISASRPKNSPEKLARIAKKIITSNPHGVSYFALHKLIFLSEVQHLNKASERIINSYVIRQKDGPYYVDLHIKKLHKLLPEVVTYLQDGALKVRLKNYSQPGLLLTDEEEQLSTRELQSIEDALKKYSKLSDSELKTKTYLTKPMRDILRREKYGKHNLFNTAVLPYLTI